MLGTNHAGHINACLFHEGSKHRSVRIIALHTAGIDLAGKSRQIGCRIGSAAGYFPLGFHQFTGTEPPEKCGSPCL